MQGYPKYLLRYIKEFPSTVTVAHSGGNLVEKATVTMTKREKQISGISGNICRGKTAIFRYASQIKHF